MFVHDELEVRLRLSMSKNDPQAKGTARPWRCVCTDIDEHSFRSCPYHAALHHVSYIKEHFPQAADDSNFPLFPDSSGRELLGDNVVDFIEFIASLLGEPLYSKGGIRRFGKHSFRSTGAVHLAEMGLEIAKIQLLGRWLCNIVLHYCWLAPLRTTADEYKRGRASGSTVPGHDTNAMKKLIVKTDKMSQTLEFVVATCESQLQEFRALITDVEKKAQPRRYIVNMRTGKVHRALTYFSEVGLDAVAYCSYKYGRQRVRLTDDLAGVQREDMCNTCLAEQRAALAPL